MKKLIVFTFLSFFLNHLMAQNAYEKGDISINAGISVGVIGYGYGYGSSGFPIPLTANVDIGISDLISVAPYVGYMRRGYGDTNNRSTFTAFSFGGQASIHLSSFLNENLDMDINEEKVDFYGKLILGYETYTWKYNGQNLNDIYGTSNSGRVIFGPVAGVRYMFKPNLGVYAEGGRGAYGWLTIGVSFKL